VNVLRMVSWSPSTPAKSRMLSLPSPEKQMLNSGLVSTKSWTLRYVLGITLTLVGLGITLTLVGLGITLTLVGLGITLTLVCSGNNPDTGRSG